jgi:hypothetical protein
MPVLRGCHSIRGFWRTSNPIDGQESSDLIVMMAIGFFRGTTYRNSWNMMFVVRSKVTQGSTNRVMANERSLFYDKNGKELDCYSDT